MRLYQLTEGKSLIQFEDVWYEYPSISQEETVVAENSTFALRGVSLTVREGEFLCILGHNGSGKSTLAKLMNALYIPSKGTVRVLGMDTAAEENAVLIRRNVGLVLQNPDNQLVTTVVEEDVAFGPENLGVPPKEIRKRVDEALETVGLTHKASAAPHMLSGGQKQRVAIAGILAMRPRVMVMDEPTAMLDPEGREEVIRTALRLCREHGLTLVLITHFINEALEADRILVMDGGRIVRKGKPRDILTEEKALLEAGLMVPPVQKLTRNLRENGIMLPKDIICTDEFVEAICAYKQIS